VQVVHGQSSEGDYLVDNPNRRCPDITKARQELGYGPRMTLEEGLRRTMRWYSGNRGGEER
jgi:UDP-glucuronate decarboxylase